MADLNALTAYLQDSISTPLLEADPVYQALQSDGIANIITQVAKNFASSITMVQPSDERMVILYAQKEIYMRLATNFAPDWNVETQYTKLLKGDRFVHYMRLVSQVSDEISFQEKNVLMPVIGHADVIISARDGSIRNYDLAEKQSPSLTIGSITTSTADLTWNQFDASLSRFSAYKIAYGMAELYDEFEDPSILYKNIIFSVNILDIFRVNYRLKNLLPDTKYYVLLVFQSMNGREDCYTVSFTTAKAS